MDHGWISNRCGWFHNRCRHPRRGAPRVHRGPQENGGDPDLDSIQNVGYAASMSGEATNEHHGELLRRHGMNVTAQRLAILQAVGEHPHSTADEILQVVRAAIGAMSRQAVYDTLAALTDKGVLRRIQPAGSSARYEDRVGDNHHHLVCRSCHQMIDVDCDASTTLCLSAADGVEHEIDDVEVIYRGRCATCIASPHTVRTPQTHRYITP